MRYGLEYGNPVIILTHDEKLREGGIFLRQGKEGTKDEMYAQIKMQEGDIQWHALWSIYPDRPAIREVLVTYCAQRKIAKKAYDDLAGSLYDLSNKITRKEI